MCTQGMSCVMRGPNIQDFVHYLLPSLQEGQLVFLIHTYDHTNFLWNRILLTSSCLYNFEWQGEVELSNKKWIGKSQCKIFAKNKQFLFSETGHSPCSLIKSFD